MKPQIKAKSKTPFKNKLHSCAAFLLVPISFIITSAPSIAGGDVDFMNRMNTRVPEAKCAVASHGWPECKYGYLPLVTTTYNGYELAHFIHKDTKVNDNKVSMWILSTGTVSNRGRSLSDKGKVQSMTALYVFDCKNSTIQQIEIHGYTGRYLTGNFVGKEGRKRAEPCCVPGTAPYYAMKEACSLVAK